MLERAFTAVGRVGPRDVCGAYVPVEIASAHAALARLQAMRACLQILVNNAGLAFKGNTFGADEAQQTIDTNLKGTRRMCDALLPLMRSPARIVNVCSRRAPPSSASSLRRGLVPHLEPRSRDS